MGKEEGRHQGQEQTCPHDCLSLSMLTLPQGPHAPVMPRDSKPHSDSSCGLWAVLEAAAVLAHLSGTHMLQPCPVALGTGDAMVKHWTSSGNSSCVPVSFPGKVMGTSPDPCSLPCPPQLLTHHLASLPALGVPQDTAPHQQPLSRASTCCQPQQWIKITQQQVHFSGWCPLLPPIPAAVAWMGTGGCLAGGGARVWSPPGPELCTSAPPAGPPQRMTPIKRSSSCLLDNKTLFLLLFYK